MSSDVFIQTWCKAQTLLKMYTERQIFFKRINFSKMYVILDLNEV